MDFDEHMYHRRIMQEAFTRTRLSGYISHMDTVATKVVAARLAVNDNRFLFMPAIKELTLDIASVVFMGHEPGSDHELVTKIKRAYETTTRAGGCDHPHAGAAVQVVAGAAGPQGPGGLLHRAGEGEARHRRAPTC